ncbi:MAG: thioredoxin family protein [Rhodoferax sp.]|uniref:thioredoxin family protein n=1 Tax=Rhodoferax sp. TaxID=50421 RepID=UPI003265172C
MKPVANPSSPTPALWVACLCADWCGSCRDYQERFEQVARAFSGAQFVWVDIEDQADVVDPIEVDNFPTVLVVVDGAVRFFGSITPQMETLQRLVQAQMETPPGSLADPAVTALAQRLRR